jgi:hypothetical protein
VAPPDRSSAVRGVIQPTAIGPSIRRRDRTEREVNILPAGESAATPSRRGPSTPSPGYRRRPFDGVSRRRSRLRSIGGFKRNDTKHQRHGPWNRHEERRRRAAAFVRGAVGTPTNRSARPQSRSPVTSGSGKMRARTTQQSIERMNEWSEITSPCPCPRQQQQLLQRQQLLRRQQQQQQQPPPTSERWTCRRALVLIIHELPYQVRIGGCRSTYYVVRG